MKYINQLENDLHKYPWQITANTYKELLKSGVSFQYICLFNLKYNVCNFMKELVQ